MENNKTYLDNYIQILNENNKVYLYGPMTECCTRNRNGRLYPKDVLKSAVLELIERVNKEGVLCYKDHPNHSDLVYEDSAGKLVEVTWDDDTGVSYCKVEILDDTKDGKQILKEIKDGTWIGGISTRGLGSLDENKIVQEGLKIITSDIIPGSSAQSCQICNLSLVESTQERTNTMDDFLIEECSCDLAKLDEVERNIVDKHIVNSFTKILTGE